MIKTPICRIYSNGDRYWHLDGIYHRIDGPAIEYSNGNKLWYLYDIQYNTKK
jgi:hypothetical protein